ncbi:MAG: DUF3429 domain-containing protein [Pseudomonadota bacterium]
MTVPRSALLLGLAGVLPFLWGALTTLLPEIGAAVLPYLNPRLIGPFVQLWYGTIILSFMSGVLWGFATKAGDWQGWGYALSTLPALFCFFFVGRGADNSADMLIVGFAGLLALDYLFYRRGLTPDWWMQLRLLLTALVIASLTAGLLAGVLG